MTPERYREIDKLIRGLPVEFATRWCEQECACMGCANRSGGLGKNGISKEEWGEWWKLTVKYINDSIQKD